MIAVSLPGLFSLIQDEGRFGQQAYGMPVAGVMDRYAYRVANLLVGNESGAAVIEMTAAGGSFAFPQGGFAAICGADMGAILNGIPVSNWSCFTVPAGGELVFGFVKNGCRAYLAVQGGIAVPLVLGSRSTYTRAGIGGFNGRALQAGDVLPIGLSNRQLPIEAALPTQYIPCDQTEICLRVLLGPQDDYFTKTGIETLFSATYIVAEEADRMGYRLEGPPIEHRGGADIVSDALCPGAIQVPGHGRPIVMLADRATTGGYAKIGAVIGPDLRLLAQAKPGDRVSFVRCTDEAAVAALKQEQVCYQAIQAILKAPQLKRGPATLFQVTVAGKLFQVSVEEVT